MLRLLPVPQEGTEEDRGTLQEPTDFAHGERIVCGRTIFEQCSILSSAALRAWFPKLLSVALSIDVLAGDVLAS